MSKLESIDRWFGTEQASVVSLSWLLFFCDLVALACLAALSPALRALPGIDPATLAKVLKLGAFMLPAWAAVAVLGRYTWDWGGAWRTALIWSVLAALIAVPLAAIHWSGSGISFLVLFIPVAVTMAAAFFGMRRGLLVWIFFTAAHAGLAVLEGLGVLPYAPLFPEVAQGIFGTPLSIFCGVFGAFAVTSVFMLASSWMVDALGRARAKAEHTLAALQSTHRDLVVAESGAAVGKMLETAMTELTRPIGNAQSLVDTALSDIRGTPAGKDLDRRDLEETLRRARDAVCSLRERVSDLGALGARRVQHVEPVDLGAVARDLAGQAHAWAENQNVRIELALDGEAPPVWANREQITDAAAALFVNALEAMAQGSGTLRIETARLGAEARLSFLDSGPGISEKDVERIFDPLFTTKDPARHAGLGLYRAREMIGLYGGRLEIGRAGAGGTRASLVLPLHPQQKAD